MTQRVNILVFSCTSDNSYPSQLSRSETIQALEGLSDKNILFWLIFNDERGAFFPPSLYNRKHG